ncbi:hypothetical protein GCM10023093_21350 [Nemorincola caseinilytica]|uniref:Uncharacterized protein n=1 Tax=Nemorincola caseinilytica TaxID=2054315 RepID=A0ABP8NJ87_9BACT
MSTENVVFRKIKEISVRGIKPRPMITVLQISRELSLTSDSLLAQLAELKRLRLVTFCDNGTTSIKLTLLGSVVRRDK